MVKKISGTGGSASGPAGASSIGSTKPTEATKATQVGGVSATKEQGQVQRLAGHGRPITAADREQLFQVIQEEAEKLFADEAVGKSKRKTVEGAVKMVIDASIAEDDKNQPSKKSQ